MDQSLLNSAIENGSVLLVLCFFVYYFMKQLGDRDAKIETMRMQILEQERQMLNTIAQNTLAFNKLCESIDNLISSINRNGV